MPPVTGIGSPGPVQPSSDAGHSAHTSSGSGTTSFAAALSQVMGRTTSTVLSGTPSPASSTGGAQSSAQRDARPSLGDVFQPRHIPLVGSGHPSHDFQQLALGLRAYRQQIIASNIANADTPNYKARDLDFSAVLAAQQDKTKNGTFALNMTNSRHIEAEGLGNGDESLMYRTPMQPSIDQNTVDAQLEQSNYAENAVGFQASFTLLNSKFKGLVSALRGE